MGKASMSALRPTVGPSPPPSSVATTPFSATPVRTSSGRPSRATRTFSAVFSVPKPSSGSRWIARLSAVISSPKPSRTSSTRPPNSRATPMRSPSAVPPTPILAGKRPNAPERKRGRPERCPRAPLSVRTRLFVLRLSLQAGVQPDVDVVPKGVGDRADLLGLAGGVLERVGVQPGHPAAHVQVDGRDLELLVVQRADGIHRQVLRRVALAGERVRERHRVAGRVGGGYELLGAGLAVGLPGARREGHRGIRQHPAPLRHRPVAAGEIPIPLYVRVAFYVSHAFLLLLAVTRNDTTRSVLPCPRPLLRPTSLASHIPLAAPRETWPPQGCFLRSVQVCAAVGSGTRRSARAAGGRDRSARGARRRRGFPSARQARASRPKVRVRLRGSRLKRPGRRASRRRGAWRGATRRVRGRAARERSRAWGGRAGAGVGLGAAWSRGGRRLARPRLCPLARRPPPRRVGTRGRRRCGARRSRRPRPRKGRAADPRTPRAPLAPVPARRAVARRLPFRRARLR